MCIYLHHLTGSSSSPSPSSSVPNRIIINPRQTNPPYRSEEDHRLIIIKLKVTTLLKRMTTTTIRLKRYYHTLAHLGECNPGKNPSSEEERASSSHGKVLGAEIFQRDAQKLAALKPPLRYRRFQSRTRPPTNLAASMKGCTQGVRSRATARDLKTYSGVCTRPTSQKPETATPRLPSTHRLSPYTSLHPRRTLAGHKD